MRSPFALMLRLSILVVAAMLLLLPRSARAAPGDEYRISLITMSPGDPVFFRFGHNAILVRDLKARTERVYNWGTFSFNEPGLITKFLQGRLTYWLSVQQLPSTLRHYQSENRWLVEQELNLNAAQKRKLVEMVRHNALPENSTYRYHYYRDNCSTRVRDVLDTVLDGKVKEASGGPAKMTFRGQTSRLVADIDWAYVALNMAMGSYIDQPITEWDEMFVPGKVHDVIGGMSNVDDQGKVVPLVKRADMLVTANRAEPPALPPNRTLSLLTGGAVVGALLGALAYWLLSWNRKLGRTPLSRRLAFALPLGALTTLTGFLGAMFVFFWTATDHEVAYHNENLLQASPLGLLVPVVAIGVLLDKAWARRLIVHAMAVLAGSSVLGLVLQVLPWFDQVNGEIIALLMPIWVGTATGALLGQRVTHSPRATVAAAQSEAKA